MTRKIKVRKVTLPWGVIREPKLASGADEIDLLIESTNWQARKGKGLQTVVKVTINLYDIVKLNGTIRSDIEKRIISAQKLLPYFEKSAQKPDDIPF